MQTSAFYQAVFNAITTDTLNPALGAAYTRWLMQDIQARPAFYAEFVNDHAPAFWATVQTTHQLPDASTPDQSAFLYSLFLASYPRLIELQRTEAHRRAQLAALPIHFVNPTPTRRGSAPGVKAHD